VGTEQRFPATPSFNSVDDTEVHDRRIVGSGDDAFSVGSVLVFRFTFCSSSFLP
jgi:hypothetical protein